MKEYVQNQSYYKQENQNSNSISPEMTRILNLKKNKKCVFTTKHQKITDQDFDLKHTAFERYEHVDCEKCTFMFITML